MSNIKHQDTDFLPAIRLGRIGVLKVHQISDEELTRLGQGSSQSLFLNFGIGVLSVASSFLIALLTTNIPAGRVFEIFVIVTVICFLAGIVLVSLWWWTRQPISILVKEIRDRLPPDGEQQTAPLTALANSTLAIGGTGPGIDMPSQPEGETR
jgi:hypothetical protein